MSTIEQSKKSWLEAGMPPAAWEAEFGRLDLLVACEEYDRASTWRRAAAEVAEAAGRTAGLEGQSLHWYVMEITYPERQRAWDAAEKLPRNLSPHRGGGFWAFGAEPPRPKCPGPRYWEDR